MICSHEGNAGTKGVTALPIALVLRGFVFASRLST
jgi:hypothetical protein